MRILLFVTALCSITPAALAQSPADTCAIIVLVSGIRNDDGLIRVALYNSEKTFLGDSSEVFRAASSNPHDGVSSVTFVNLPPGTYAIAVLHDENLNKKMDKGMFGIPKEGYGFSNDASGFMGPPSFRKAGFSCAGDTTRVTIRIKY